MIIFFHVHSRVQTFGFKCPLMVNGTLNRFLNLLTWFKRTLLQVANYCCERLHSALAEELQTIEFDLTDGIMGETQQVKWEKALTSCFQTVDDEIGGKVSRGISGSNEDASEPKFEPIAPETVGSTAVVALICSSHIIVANCGDSRAVLCRGKQPVPLSVDHKVSACLW